MLKSLEKLAYPKKQAEVQAEALAKIIEARLLTEKDIKEPEFNFKNEFNLKIAELKFELILWMLGVAVAQSAIIISCIKSIHKCIY